MILTELMESKTAPLYHGTPMLFLAAIIASDHLGAGMMWGRPGEPEGPRLSRSYATAISFALDNEYGTGGVLVLDQEKLSHNHKIVPYADVDMRGERWTNEYEEVPLAPMGIKPISKYLLSINVDPASIREILADQSGKAYGVSMADGGDECVSVFATFEQCENALQGLLDHPKLNAMGPRGRFTPTGWVYSKSGTQYQDDTKR